MMNLGALYMDAQIDLDKAEELFRSALEGFEAQFGKDHQTTKMCAENVKRCIGHKNGAY